MNSRPSLRISRRLVPALLILIAMLVAFAPAAPAALPVPGEPVADARHQTPGWMTPDIVNRLSAVGAPVLAPSYLPGAVGFLPSVDAYWGYYSFYWLVPGTPPTYLHVTGTVGGSIPAYSKYDRNVQLTQNATVLGYPAYHDLTPIYDLVYFAIGGVVYSVESNNIADTSLGIANSLTYVDVPIWEPEPTPVPVDTTPPQPGPGTDPTTPVEQPATTAPVVTTPTIVLPSVAYSEEMVIVGVSGISSANLAASDGLFTLTGRSTINGVETSSFQWIAPQTDRTLTVRFTLTDPATGATLTEEILAVERTPDELIPVSANRLSCPVEVPMGQLAAIEIDGSGRLIIDASDGSFPDVGPNSTFAGNGEVDGSDVLAGAIRTSDNSWVFFAPVQAPGPYTVYLFLQNWDGVTLLECGINIVMPTDAPTYPEMGPQDGTGIVGGIAVAPLGNTPEGTSVRSPDMPGQGYLPDGSIAEIPSYPWSDGTTVTTTADTAPTPVTSDGTAIEPPVSATDDT